MLCHDVGDQVENCKLGLFQDASFAGDLRDSKQHWVVYLWCIFGDRTFVPTFVDVQEANSSFSQQYRGRSNLPGCGTANGTFTGSKFVWECVVDVLSPANKGGRRLHAQSFTV